MNYYQITGTSRQNLRQILRTLNQYKVIYSSCYQLDEELYILISCDSTILGLDVFSPIEKSLITTNTPLELLWNWAYAELQQDLNWIELEDKAHNGLNCAYLIQQQTRIIRTFLPLTEIMLIINQTPDSFSDGGKFYRQTDQTIAMIEQALIEGVSIIDIGAESTRPGANYLTPEEEIERLKAIIYSIHELKARYKFKLSLDSYKSATIQTFLPYIDIVNDVSANLPIGCLEQIQAENKMYLFMHNLSIPANPKLTLDTKLNPINEINNWLDKKITQLFALGFRSQQLISDPGIGFNKTANQSWYLLKHMQQLRHNEIEILVGHSRKSFLNKLILNTDIINRDNESAHIACYLSTQGSDYIRLHNYQTYHQQIISQNQLHANCNHSRIKP